MSLSKWWWIEALLHVNLKLVTVSIAQKSSTLCAIGILTMIRYDQRQKAHHLGHNLGQTMLGLSRFRLNSQQHFYFYILTTLPQCKSTPMKKPMSHKCHISEMFHLIFCQVCLVCYFSVDVKGHTLICIWIRCIGMMWKRFTIFKRTLSQISNFYQKGLSQWIDYYM